MFVNMKKVYKTLPFFCIVLLMFQIAIAGTAPSLLVLSPGIGEEIKEGSTVVIAISLSDPDGDIDQSSFSLYVDNKNVISNSNVSIFLVTYTIEDVQGIGKHSFVFKAKDREGNLSTISGYFYVAKKKIKKEIFSYNGSVKMGGRYDKEASEDLVGVASVNLYGNIIEVFTYSLNVELTNELTSEKQRVSTYRLDIDTPIGLYVFGDTTPSFTDYSINGTRVFGFHLMPQLGPIGFEILYGQSSKAIKSPETYKRMVYGGKLKIGNKDSFLWGLSVLKAKDDKNSLDFDPENITPKDNLVVSTNFSIKALSGLLSLKAEANESLLNEDITSGASSFEDFNLPINPEDYDWLFTINEHIVPIMPGLTNLAAKGSLVIGPVFDNTFNFEYFYIGPSYYSLLNSGLTNDRSGFNIYDTLWLFNRMIYMNSSFLYNWNNLENTLSHTTKTQGYSLNVSAFPNDYLTIDSSFSISMSSNNYDVDTKNITAGAGVKRDIELGNAESEIMVSLNTNIYRDEVTSGNNSERYSIRTGLSSNFNYIPLSTRGVLGYDFGSTPSIYIEGWAEYSFLKDQSLNLSSSVVYQSYTGGLDINSSMIWKIFYDIDFNADFRYITNTGDFYISAFASRTF